MWERSISPRERGVARARCSESGAESATVWIGGVSAMVEGPALCVRFISECTLEIDKRSRERARDSQALAVVGRV